MAPKIGAKPPAKGATKNQLLKSDWDSLHSQSRFRPRYPNEEVVRWVFRNVKLPATVLDLGCGAGRHAMFLSGEGYKTYACDSSIAGLRYLEELAREKNIEVNASQTGAEDLSIYTNSMFDAVICFGVLYYLAPNQVVQCLREVRRVLKPQGRFLCVTRTNEDERCRRSTRVTDDVWQIGDLGPNAPSDAEAGMNMLFLSRARLQNVFSEFSAVSIGRMTIVTDNFRNDDWIVSAVK